MKLMTRIKLYRLWLIWLKGMVASTRNSRCYVRGFSVLIYLFLSFSMPSYTIIGSDNGLSSDQPQAIIRTNACMLLIRPLSIKFSREMWIKIQQFLFKKASFIVSSARCRLFCLGLNGLTSRGMTQQNGEALEIKPWIRLFKSRPWLICLMCCDELTV